MTDEIVVKLNDYVLLDDELVGNILMNDHLIEYFHPINIYFKARKS